MLVPAGQAKKSASPGELCGGGESERVAVCPVYTNRSGLHAPPVPTLDPAQIGREGRISAGRHGGVVARPGHD